MRGPLEGYKVVEERDGAPMVPGPAFGDLQSGMCLASGILAALLAREKTGKGDRVAVSLRGVGVYLLHLLHQARQDGYEFPMSRKEAPTPSNNTYQTKDGRWMFLAVPDYNRDFNRLITVLGREDLVDDSRYATIGQLRKQGLNGELVSIIEEQFAQKTLAEWQEVFTENDIACETCMVSKEVLEDPEAWENEFVQKHTFPTGNERIVFNNPIRIESYGVPPYRPSKGIGADTDAILRDSGYTAEKIESFKKCGAVIQHS
jgi:crotonobetainyl-CoA:carnitine CoA-transferase CaiB-like acyl-CoA transferase